MIQVETWRDNKGRFLPGNRASAPENNPMCRAVWKLKEEMLSVCTVDEMNRLTKKLLSLCHDKDSKVALQAMELLLNRLFGKPLADIQLAVRNEQSTNLNVDAYSPEQLEAMLSIIEAPANHIEHL